MAGDPLTGGGFVILNGLGFDDDGNIFDLDTPLPRLEPVLAGIRRRHLRPRSRIVSSIDEQLNGGEYFELTDTDWKLIKPYLEENERLFDIPVSRLLTVDGTLMEPHRVYRKVAPLRKRSRPLLR